MSNWRNDRPRPHHYEVAHRALPAILRKPGVDVLGLLDAGRLDDALAATWTTVGEK